MLKYLFLFATYKRRIDNRADSSTCIADAGTRSDASHTDLLHSKQIPSTGQHSLLQKEHKLLPPPHACPPCAPFHFIRRAVLSQLKETGVFLKENEAPIPSATPENILPSARSFLNYGVAAAYYSQY